MRGTLLRVLSAVLLAAVAAGCGDDDKKSGPRGGGDLAGKQIKAAEQSAARRCLTVYARRKRLAAEASKARISLPLRKVESRLKAAEGRAKAAPRNPEAQAEVARAGKECDLVRARIAPELAPVRKAIDNWAALLKALKKSKGKRFCEIVDHTVEEQNPKTPSDLRSVMRLKPIARKDILGAGELKFNLSWRKIVRTTGYGKHKKHRVNWELRKVGSVATADEDEDEDEDED